MKTRQLSLGDLFITLLLLSILNIIKAEEWRTFDGQNNNKQNTNWGTPFSPFKPVYSSWSPRYKDGKGQLFHTDDLRNLSLSLFSNSWQTFDKESGMSNFATQFAGFLFLDMGRRAAGCPLSICEGGETHQVPIPRCDSLLDPFCVGNMSMSIKRSFYLKGTGQAYNSSFSIPRQVVYEGTAWLDLDVIYGSDPLRSVNRINTANVTFDRSRKGQLARPTEPQFISLIDSTSDPLFWQWIYIWTSEHNRNARQMSNEHIDWSEEKVFQMARKWTIALYQKIVTRDYLATVSSWAPLPYAGYKPYMEPMVDPVVKHVIARYGHYSQPNFVQLLDENFEPFEQYEFPVSEFRSDWVSKKYFNFLPHYIRGLVAERSYSPTRLQAARTMLMDSRDRDVLALDLFRSQDVGLPLFNQARQAYGFPPIQQFEELTTNNRTVDILKSVYKSVDELELVAGLFAEDPQPGGHISLFMTVLLWNQLNVLRDADRFWYEAEGVFTTAEVSEIFDTTVGELLKRNIPDLGEEFPDHPFFVRKRQLDSQSSGALFSADGDYEHRLDLSNSFRLSWTADFDNQIIRFMIQAATEGWVSIGFDSDDGTMKNGDIIICRFDSSNKLEITDTFSPDIGQPVNDVDLGTTDDLIERSGSIINGIGIYRFARKFVTNDVYDKPIKNEKQKVIFAYHPSTNAIIYHGPTRSASRYINLLDRKAEEDTSEALIIVSSIIVGSGIIFGLLVLIFTFTHSRHFRFSSVMFARLSTIGAITGLVSAILMFPRPTGNLCIASFWILGVSFYIIFSLTSVKIWRLYIIYRQLLNDQFLPLKPPSNRVLLICVVCCVIGECIFHIIWVTVDKLDAERVLNGNQYWYRCKSNLAFWMIFVVSKLVFLLMTSVMCFLSRKIPHKYSEAGRLSVTVYGVFVTVCVVLPLGFAVDNVNGRFVIQVFPIFITFFGFLICVFGPIMIRIISGQDAVDMRKMLREITMVDTKRGGAKATHIISSSTHQSAPSVNNSNE